MVVVFPRHSHLSSELLPVDLQQLSFFLDAENIFYLGMKKVSYFSSRSYLFPFWLFPEPGKLIPSLAHNQDRPL